MSKLIAFAFGQIVAACDSVRARDTSSSGQCGAHRARMSSTSDFAELAKQPNETPPAY